MSRTKVKTLPGDYTPGLLRRVDRRTQMGRRVYAHFNAIVADLGGFRCISHTKIALIERLVFMICLMEKHEDQMLRDQLISDEQGAKFTQMANAILGIANKIGLDKARVGADSLDEYLSKKRS